MKKYDLYLRNTVGGGDFDPDYVDYVLDKHAGQEVNVLISSLGGSVNAGLRIADAFRRHGNVTVHLTGMCASAATIAAMGAKWITMYEHGLYLIHKCSEMVFEFDSMNADELRQRIEDYSKAAENLDKIDATIANLYAERAAKDNLQVLIETMTKGGWLTAQEALNLGLVDALTVSQDEVIEDSDEEVEISDSMLSEITACGLPVPDCFASMQEKVTEGKWMAWLSKLFSKFAEKQSAAIKQPVVEDSKVEEPAVDNSKIEALEAEIKDLKEQHVEALEAIDNLEHQILELNQDNKALQACKEDLQKQIQAYKDMPADESVQVMQTGKQSDVNIVAETIAAAQSLWNQLEGLQ